MRRILLILSFIILIVVNDVFPQEEEKVRVLYDYSHYRGLLSSVYDGGNIIKFENLKEFEQNQSLRLYGILALYLTPLQLSPEISMNNLTQEILDDIDILVIRTPFFRIGFSDYYSDAEAQLIEKYVSDGGSLFVLSDGGGDYYQNTNLNDIVNKFGIHFNDDFVIDKESEKGQEVNFQFNKTKLNKIKVLNVCSIKIENPKPEDKIIWSGKNSLLMPREYLSGRKEDVKLNNFYTDNINKEPSSFPIGILRYYGEGRILALGSNCLLPFPYFYWDILENDNIDFLFHAIRWLQRIDIDEMSYNELTNLKRRADYYRKKVRVLLESAKRFGIETSNCEKNMGYSTEYFERGNFTEAISYAQFAEMDISRNRQEFHENRQNKVLLGTLFAIVVLYHFLWGLTRLQFIVRDKIKLGISIAAILFFSTGFLIQGWGIIIIAPIFFVWAGVLIFFKGNLLEKLFRSSLLSAFLWFLLFAGLFFPTPLKYPQFLSRSINMSNRVEPSNTLVQDLTEAFEVSIPPEISLTNKAIMVESFVDKIIQDKSYFSLLGVTRYIPTVSEMLGWGGAQSEKNILSVSLLKNMGYESCSVTFGFPYGSYPHTWTTVDIDNVKIELGTQDYYANNKAFQLNEEQIQWIKSPVATFTSALFLDYPLPGLMPLVFLILFLSGFASIYWDGDISKKAVKMAALLGMTAVISLVIFILFNINSVHFPEVADLADNVKYARSPVFFVVLFTWGMAYLLSVFSRKASKNNNS